MSSILHFPGRPEELSKMHTEVILINFFPFFRKSIVFHISKIHFLVRNYSLSNYCILLMCQDQNLVELLYLLPLATWVYFSPKIAYNSKSKIKITNFKLQGHKGYFINVPRPKPCGTPFLLSLGTGVYFFRKLLITHNANSKSLFFSFRVIKDIL